MTEQEKDEIRELIKIINEENKKQDEENENKHQKDKEEYDNKLKREVILNGFFNTGQEIDKTIITLSSGAIAVFSAMNGLGGDNKILFILGLVAFLIGVVSSIFSLVLNKKDLEEKWNEGYNPMLEYFIKIFGNIGIFSFLFGVIMISIIMFIKITSNK